MKNKEMKKDTGRVPIKKEAGIAVSVSDQTDFKAESHLQNKGHFIINEKRNNARDDIMILHLYASSSRRLKMPEINHRNSKEQQTRPQSWWGVRFPALTLIK